MADRFFFVPNFVLFAVRWNWPCHARIGLRKSILLPVNCHRNVIIRIFHFSRDGKRTTETAMSQLCSSKIRMAHWIGIFIRTLRKVFDLRICSREKFFICFMSSRKFFSMLVKLCNVFYRPRPLFMATDPFLFTLCIKLTQHKHLPYHRIIKSTYHREQKNLLKMFKAIILCCVVCDMEWYEKCKPHQLYVCARPLCHRGEEETQCLSLYGSSTATMYYNIIHVDIYVCFRRAFG